MADIDSSMTTPYLIAQQAKCWSLPTRLASKTVQLENGCWYCSAGGEESRYGAIWHQGANIGNHVAAWLCWKGPVPTGQCVLHTCDNMRCVNPHHLFLGTNDDNSKDMVAKERQWKPKGTLNSCAVLNDDIVREIRFQLEHSGTTQQSIADYYGVSQSIISDIKRGRKWAHVK